MSINDVLDSDIVLPAMAIIFIVIMIIAIPAGISKSKKANESIYGDNSDDVIKEERNAKIIAIRSNPHPLYTTIIINSVVFELVNGNRLELAIKDPNVFGVMVEGDIGILKYQGKKFIGFVRSNRSEA